MIRRLARSIREYKKASILTPIFVSMEVVMEVLIPLLMASLIDDGINAGNMNVILKIGAVLVVSTIVSLLFGALSGRYAAVASAGYARNLRHDMFYAVQGVFLLQHR